MTFSTIWRSGEQVNKDKPSGSVWNAELRGEKVTKMWSGVDASVLLQSRQSTCSIKAIWTRIFFAIVIPRK